MRRTTACILLLAATTPALAQTSRAEIVFDIENDRLLPGQSTTVTLWAAWPSSEYALAGIATDLGITTGADGWSDWRLADRLRAPGTSAGAATESGFTGIVAGQVYFPIAGPEIDLSNPIAFWSATYSAPADVPTAFDIELATLTRSLQVYIHPDSSAAREHLPDLVEGSASIHVIPAPAGALTLAAGLVLARRRR